MQTITVKNYIAFISSPATQQAIALFYKHKMDPENLSLILTLLAKHYQIEQCDAFIEIVLDNVSTYVASYSSSGSLLACIYDCDADCITDADKSAYDTAKQQIISLIKA